MTARELWLAWILALTVACTVDGSDLPNAPANRSSASDDLSVPDRDGDERSLPRPRDGADILGRNISTLLPDRWIGPELDFASAGEEGSGESDHVTLIRFWTDTCPFCAASLPAVESLRDTYEPRGLRTLAVYHPKPPRSVDDDEVSSWARRHCRSSGV